MSTEPARQPDSQLSLSSVASAKVEALNSQLVGPRQPVDLALPGGAELIAFPSGRYAIPSDDMADFGKLAVKEQERVKFLLGLFAKMEAGGIVAMSETLGFQLRAVRGYSASNLRAAYYKWIEGGWRMVARRYTNGGEGLPIAFVQHLRALMENNARSMKQAMNMIKREWFLGKSIPGYGTWQEWFLTQWPERELPTVCPGTPRGWSKSNLYSVQPVKAQRALKTRGFAAAKALLGSIVRDPSTLLPLQLVVIDDFEADQKCFYWDPVKGTRAIVRMAGVAAMDVATRRIIGLIFKPRLTDDEGAKQSITRADVRLLLYGILRDYGVPAHGMTIMAENAAAAVTTELELTFTNLFGGKIAITRTGVIDRALVEHGFKDTGGKPWLKGWIESFFNLLHNVAGFLPGQKGSSYLTKPADFDEKERLTLRLVGTGRNDAQLSDEQLAKARLPFLSPGELHDAYLQLFRWIEERTDHELRGFAKVIEWRSHESEPWQPFEALATLTDEQQLSALVRERMQSPRERWAVLFPRITCHPVPAHVAMMLCLTPKKTELKSARLTFTHNGTGYTWLADPRGELAQSLRDGAEVLVYFDATQPLSAHVTDLQGRYLGEVRRLGPVNITDTAAVTDAEKQLAQHYAAHLEEIRARPLHQLEAAKMLEDRTVNAALVDEAKQLRNTQGVTATLNRPVPAAAIAAGGDQLGAAVATRDLRRLRDEAQRKALRKAGDQSESLLDSPAPNATSASTEDLSGELI
jgi:hypothetical protein